MVLSTLLFIAYYTSCLGMGTCKLKIAKDFLIH